MPSQIREGTYYASLRGLKKVQNLNGQAVKVISYVEKKNNKDGK